MTVSVDFEAAEALLKAGYAAQMGAFDGVRNAESGTRFGTRFCHLGDLPSEPGGSAPASQP